MKCKLCGETVGVVRRPARTAYVAPELTDWERLGLEEGGLAIPPDPNPDLDLCPACSEEYDEWWDEQWREYYMGLLWS